MQSSHQVKRITEYQIGERVYEGDYYAGRIISIFISGVTGYILLINSKEEYTIYRGINNRCSLTLTRNIPETVAIQFARIILGQEELPSVTVERPVPVKEKIVKTPVAPVIKSPVMETHDSEDSTLSFYFDFV